MNTYRMNRSLYSHSVLSIVKQTKAGEWNDGNVFYALFLSTHAFMHIILKTFFSRESDSRIANVRNSVRLSVCLSVINC